MTKDRVNWSFLVSSCLLAAFFCSPVCLLLVLLLQLGVLSEAEAEGVIALEFNPVRVGFHGGAGEWAPCHVLLSMLLLLAPNLVCAIGWSTHWIVACPKHNQRYTKTLACAVLCCADVWTKDVLNLGVKPDKLVSLVRDCLRLSGSIARHTCPDMVMACGST
jgi:hypothetical protein